MDILKLMDHISNAQGISDFSKTPYKLGYMASMLKTLSDRYPEVAEYINRQALYYNYKEL